MRAGTILGTAALLVAGGTAAYWFHLASQVSLPADRTAFVVLWLFAAALGVMAFFKRPGILGGIPATLSIIIGLFLPFTVYISPQALADGSIEVGDSLPDFSTPTDKGEVFDSSSLNGHLVLIKFFRAHW
jgi:hypothetical protein